MSDYQAIPAAAPGPAGEAPAQPRPTAPQPAPKVRRVGTFSLGLMLVAVGAVLLAGIFLPDTNVLGMLKFAPVILIVLGIEVLAYAARPDVKIKYDGLSIVLCIVLMLFCGASGVLAWASNWLDPDRVSAAYAQRRQLYADLPIALEAIPNAHEFIRDYSICQDSDRYVLDLLAGNTETRLYLTMNAGAQADAAAFARDCKAVADACRAAGLDFDSYVFDVYYGDSTDKEQETWKLTLDNWSAGSTVDELTGRVETVYYYDGEAFSTREALLNYRHDRDAELLQEGYVQTFGTDPQEDYAEQYGSVPTGEKLNDFMVGRLAAATAETAQQELSIAAED